MAVWRKRILLLLAVVIVAAVLVWSFRPTPVQVDVVTVSRGPLMVTVDEDGETQVRDRYVVSAPLAGALRRIRLDAGDAVEAGQVVAVIEPPEASLLDVRTWTEAAARVQAAEAAVDRAQAGVELAAAQLALARSDREQLEQLRQADAATQREYNEALLLERVRENELEAARWAQQVARGELEVARATLQLTSGQTPGPRQLELRSPIAGRVFRVLQESSGFVTAGQELLELGDPRDVEARIDVLSNDAVRIRPGARVYMERWGGDQPLTGRVRLIEPSGFLKISALGVEEQRVNVIADIDEDQPQIEALGDGYRVEARIVVWQEEDVLKIPAGALFRQGDRWAVFVIEQGVAQLRLVEVGQQSQLEAQILAGLREGEQLVAYPSDEVAAGRRVAPRER